MLFNTYSLSFDEKPFSVSLMGSWSVGVEWYSPREHCWHVVEVPCLHRTSQLLCVAFWQRGSEWEAHWTASSSSTDEVIDSCDVAFLCDSCSAVRQSVSPFSFIFTTSFFSSKFFQYVVNEISFFLQYKLLRNEVPNQLFETLTLDHTDWQHNNQSFGWLMASGTSALHHFVPLPSSEQHFPPKLEEN